MPEIVRLGDLSTSDPCGAPSRPNSQGCATVFCNNIPVHCQTHAWEPHACPGDSPHNAITSVGSSTVFAENLPVARIGDPISCGSNCMTGSSNSFAGG